MHQQSESEEEGQRSQGQRRAARHNARRVIPERGVGSPSMGMLLLPKRPNGGTSVIGASRTVCPFCAWLLASAACSRT